LPILWLAVMPIWPYDLQIKPWPPEPEPYYTDYAGPQGEWRAVAEDGSRVLLQGYLTEPEVHRAMAEYNSRCRPTEVRRDLMRDRHPMTAQERV
jgi:hypothetical protein